MRRDLGRELVADLEQIEDNAELYLRGRKSAYQAVAIQLRNLLLGGRRGLLCRIVPDIHLHAFRPGKAPTDDEIIKRFHQPTSKRVISTTLDVRGQLVLSTGNGAPVQVKIEFDDRPNLTIDQWLDQWIINPDLKVRSLIEGVANEEVAHTQESLGRDVVKAAEWTLAGRAQGHEVRHAVIVALGQYIAHRARGFAIPQEAHG